MSKKPPHENKSSYPSIPVATNGQQPERSNQALNVSIIMAGINLGLLTLLVVVIGPSGAFQLLFGFEASPQEKGAMGGLIYAIGVLIVFFIRLGFFPAFTVISLVGVGFGWNAILKARSQSEGLDPFLIGLLIFHSACLIPPMIFAVRTLMFLSLHS